MDIITRIDAAISATQATCACGCAEPITDASPSPYFAGPNCQTRWYRAGRPVPDPWPPCLTQTSGGALNTDELQDALRTWKHEIVVLPQDRPHPKPVEPDRWWAPIADLPGWWRHLLGGLRDTIRGRRHRD